MMVSVPTGRVGKSPGLQFSMRFQPHQKASTTPTLWAEHSCPRIPDRLALWVVASRGIGDNSHLLVSTCKQGKPSNI